MSLDEASAPPPSELPYIAGMYALNKNFTSSNSLTILLSGFACLLMLAGHTWWGWSEVPIWLIVIFGVTCWVALTLRIAFTIINYFLLSVAHVVGEVAAMVTQETATQDAIPTSPLLGNVINLFAPRKPVVTDQDPA